MIWIFVSSILILIGIAFLFVKRNRNELEGMFDLFKDMANLLWLFWCWICTIRWRLYFDIKNAVARTAAGVLLVGSFYIFLELTIVIINLLTTSASASPCPSIDNKKIEHVQNLLPHIYELPIQGDLILVALAAIVFFHHWHHWKLGEREATMPLVLANVIGRWRTSFANGPLTEDKKRELFEAATNDLLQILRVGRKSNISFTVSLAKVGANGKLFTITRYFPGPALPGIIGTTLDEKSAAGRCFRERVPIYVPSTRHRGGINTKTFRITGIDYYPIDGVDIGPSLMCLPIVNSGQITGILNVSAGRTNAFEPLDFKVAGLIAILLAEVV